MAKKILFTGGGSAGHVTLNLALVPIFQKEGWEISYIGSMRGIEKDLVSKIENIKYFEIHTGKLRRYFSLKNFLDMMKIPLGMIQAYFIVRKEKPDVIFSKGGFVSFPVVVAGWLNRVKVIMHESDVTPGLANKLSLPFVTKFFTTFDDTIKYVKNKSKVEYVGPVVSDRLKKGVAEKGYEFCGLTDFKPILLVMGGSLGAKSINDAVRKNLEFILKKYQVIHLCGKGQLAQDIKKKGYLQYEYVNKELPDLMAIADVVISRSGSNSIFEFLSLNKPMVLVPLPSRASRGEQSLNAKSFEDKGFCEIIEDEELGNGKEFLYVINKVYENKEDYAKAMKDAKTPMASDKSVYKKIVEIAKI
ncbi:MAG: undecaprenyldiphospho-muramoylpentapeptide beta-N-acetylglucosaminyltransferase [Alphaproteobacteria bacterium]